MNKLENVIVVLHTYLHKYVVCWNFLAGLDFFLKSEREKLEKNNKASNQEYETTSICEEMKFTDTFQLYYKHILAVTQNFI